MVLSVDDQERRVSIPEVNHQHIIIILSSPEELLLHHDGEPLVPVLGLVAGEERVLSAGAGLQLQALAALLPGHPPPQSLLHPAGREQLWN